LYGIKTKFGVGVCITVNSQPTNKTKCISLKILGASSDIG